jgi:hypothetical protein
VIEKERKTEGNQRTKIMRRRNKEVANLKRGRDGTIQKILKERAKQRKRRERERERAKKRESNERKNKDGRGKEGKGKNKPRQINTFEEQ